MLHSSPSSNSNPFSTRFVQPGALPYYFPEKCGVNGVVEVLQQLQSQNWWGEIIGPHGSGKSTLLRALIPELQNKGRVVVHAALHDRQRRLPSLEQVPKSGGEAASDVRWPSKAVENRGSTALEGHRTCYWGAHTQVVIDGYEQLGWWSRRRLRRTCRKKGAGLLVTAHRSVGLPHLLATETSLELAQRIVRRILPEERSSITEADIRQCYEASGGDLRETFFLLYDLYESRRGIL